MQRKAGAATGAGGSRASEPSPGVDAGTEEPLVFHAFNEAVPVPSLMQPAAQPQGAQAAAGTAAAAPQPQPTAAPAAEAQPPKHDGEEADAADAIMQQARAQLSARDSTVDGDGTEGSAVAEADQPNEPPGTTTSKGSPQQANRPHAAWKDDAVEAHALEDDQAELTTGVATDLAEANTALTLFPSSSVLWQPQSAWRVPWSSQPLPGAVVFATPPAEDAASPYFVNTGALEATRMGAQHTEALEVGLGASVPHPDLASLSSKAGTPSAKVWLNRHVPRAFSDMQCAACNLVQCAHGGASVDYLAGALHCTS